MAETVTTEILDGPTATTTYWTTVNASEGIPGIATPLTWWWYGGASELALRRSFFNIGALEKASVPTPAEPDDRLLQVFLGRCALNVDNFRRLADRLPGSSGDSFEKQFFGCTRPGIESHVTWRRYPVVALRFPYSAIRCPREVRALRRRYHSWWSETVDAMPAADLYAARTSFLEAHRYFSAMLAPHITCSYLTQGIYEQLIRLCERAGMPHLHGALTTGLGAMEETVALRQIWDLAHGEPTVATADIIREHGYTGTGELAQRSWRENTQLVDGLLERYRSLPTDRSPEHTEARQHSERVQARSELLGALPARLRPLAHLVLRLTETFFPLREIGRASMLMSIDAGRAAARAFGGQLAAAGQLSRADDVFFLTGDELNGALEATQGHLAARVATRRSRREYYESISLPDTWTGTPTPQTSSISETYPDAIIRGIGVNGQSVEGQVRVVLDPDEGEDLAPGEILVCPMTDPSWVSLFYLAKAVVVDMGGPMSHGAIVARELGIPCIVNTRDGTRRLHTGDVVTVDPDVGTITIRQPRNA